MRSAIFACLTLTLAAPALAGPPQPEEPMHYPKSRVDDAKDLMYGVTVRDPYRWLEDAKSPEVQKWMHDQDHLARSYLHALPGRDALVARLRQLYYVDSISAPVHRGSRYFYYRRHADKEKAILYFRQGEAGAEHVLLDPNTMSTDGSVSLGVAVPSWDGEKLAYALHRNNSDEATLYVRDVASGKDSAVDTIEGAKYASPSWTPSGDGFYYTFLPSGPHIPVADRPGYAEVRFHQLGTDPKHDPLIHARTGDPRTFIGAGLSRDGHWLVLSIQHGWNAADVYYRDARQHDPAWKPLVVGLPSLFEVSVWQDHFYVRTNDGAPRWRIFRVDPRHPARSHWKEIVPEPAHAVLDGLEIVGGHLALTYLHDASSELEIRTLAGARVRSVPLPALGSSGGLTGNPEDDTAYFGFASYTHPHEVWKTSIASGKTSLWAQTKLPIDPSPYAVDQVWYPSKDGTRISMFIVHRKDLRRDGSTPFLLTAYGGFNISLLPEFSPMLYAWLELGGGFAIPNLRGGGEYGEAWHKAGMGAHKQNVFDDFLGAAEYLTKNGYTRPGRLGIRGGSNGGLLMGAALTQAPQLFGAVICEVPLLDMIRYTLFGSGKTWISEYGSADTEAGFKTLYAYSPYHHVHPGTAYPPVLIMSADSDDRVDPMHARKMAAELQADSSSGKPILLRIEKHSGHGGADMVREAVEMTADRFLFLMHELGMTPPRS